MQANECIHPPRLLKEFDITSSISSPPSRDSLHKVPIYLVMVLFEPLTGPKEKKKSEQWVAGIIYFVVPQLMNCGIHKHSEGLLNT